jgi:hypothetical protein
LNLGDLSRHVRDIFFGEWEADMFFWDSFLHGGMECPAKNHDSACAISPGGRKKRFHGI